MDFFLDKILLCDPSCFPSHYVDWLTGPTLTSAYRMLGLPPYSVGFIFWKFKSFMLGSGAPIFNPSTQEGSLYNSILLRLWLLVFYISSKENHREGKNHQSPRWLRHRKKFKSRSYFPVWVQILKSKLSGRTLA